MELALLVLGLLGPDPPSFHVNEPRAQKQTMLWIEFGLYFSLGLGDTDKSASLHRSTFRIPGSSNGDRRDLKARSGCWLL